MSSVYFDLSAEYYYYQDLGRRMARCCKLGRNIEADEAYHYLNLPGIKTFKEACIACVKDNRRYVIFSKNVKSWFYKSYKHLKSLKQNKEAVF